MMITRSTQALLSTFALAALIAAFSCLPATAQDAAQASLQPVMPNPQYIAAERPIVQRVAQNPLLLYGAYALALLTLILLVLQALKKAPVKEEQGQAAGIKALKAALSIPIRAACAWRNGQPTFRCRDTLSRASD